MATAPLLVKTKENRSVVWNDGARTSWTEHMLCTCLVAKNQPIPKNCCKHVTEAIRLQLDFMMPGLMVYIPMVLPADGGVNPQSTEICWVRAFIEKADGALYGYFAGPEHVLISYVGIGGTSRLTVRNLLVPYLLGAAMQADCTQCTRPRRVDNLLLNRDSQDAQIEAIREGCHWLEHQDLHLCLDHDDTDLIPF